MLGIHACDGVLVFGYTILEPRIERERPTQMLKNSMSLNLVAETICLQGKILWTTFLNAVTQLAKSL